jgi:hypothetical protein
LIVARNKFPGRNRRFFRAAVFIVRARILRKFFLLSLPAARRRGRCKERFVCLPKIGAGPCPQWMAKWIAIRLEMDQPEK